MRVRRILCVVFACLLAASSIGIPVKAYEAVDCTPVATMQSIAISRASNTYNMTIPAKSKIRASTSFSLVAGETVTFRASYAPVSASVDFGLIGPNGTYYFFNVTNGSIDKTLQVSQTGDYTLQIRNNSYYGVEVAGIVQY